MRIDRRTLLAGLAAAPLLPGAALARPAGEPVDLALLMMVDASASISKGTLAFQLEGHAAAFRHPAVAEAIAGGARGRVAVALAQFAGPDAFATLLPWTPVHDAADAARVADAIDAVPGVFMGGSTAIGNAVVQGVRLLDRCPFDAAKRKIDLVSNGFSNAGVDLPSARAFADAAGITVNALAILDEYDWLEQYYADGVIAGDDAFVRTAENRASFAEAFLAKLVTEIA
ncbi:MAG TPA: DUF1194 domain-containing protein [Azospirillaceae bacterium]|nr:DUF1194 domain-containing protein [Azospirillaceae bacterium]